MSDFWIGFVVGVAAAVAGVLALFFWFNARPPRGMLPW